VIRYVFYVNLVGITSLNNDTFALSLISLCVCVYIYIYIKNKKKRGGKDYLKEQEGISVNTH